MSAEYAIDGSKIKTRAGEISYSVIRGRYTKLYFDDWNELSITTANPVIDNVNQIIARHIRWIESNSVKLRDKVKLVNANGILHMGMRHSAHFAYGADGVEIIGNTIFVSGKDKERCARNLIDFIANESETECKRIAEELKVSMNVEFSQIRMLNASSMWGSCSHSKTIKINSLVCMLPKDLMRYVVCHEMAHLKHMNHSKSFWKEVMNVCPDYAILDKKLNTYDAMRINANDLVRLHVDGSW